MTREDHVVAFGGGVVGDLAGFCAATYQRGVPVVQVPTTLVAQVDSAYGGKTGVDLPEAKNYVGAYHLPAAVLADTAMLATLPPSELAAGFVEVVKTGLIAGGALWERVRAIERLDPARARRRHLRVRPLQVRVVAADERDGGLRARPQPRPHRRPRDRGGERLLALPPRRGGRARAAGGAAPLRGADELRDEVEEILRRHGLPVSLDPAVAVDAVIDALRATRSGPPRGSASSSLDARASPAKGRSSSRIGSARPWRSSLRRREELR